MSEETSAPSPNTRATKELRRYGSVRAVAPRRTVCQEGAVSMFRHEFRRSTPRLRQVVVAGIVVGIFVALATIPTSRSIEASCTLSPSGISELKAPHAGLIVAVHTREGASVAQGDVVADYDTTDAQHRRGQLQDTLKSLAAKRQALTGAAHRKLVAAVDKAEAARAQAKAALERAKGLAKRPAEKKLAKAEALLARARTDAGPSSAELDVAEAKARDELERLQTNAEASQLQAPTAGRVRSVHLAAGTTVEAGAVLLELDLLDPLKVTVSTDEQSIEPGTTAELHLEQYSQQVTLQVGGVASLENHEHHLSPGQPCTARLAGAAHPLLHW